MRLSILVLLAACGDNLPAPVTPPPPGSPVLARTVRTPDLAGCAWASPVISGDDLIVATGAGEVAAYAADGSEHWHVTIAPDVAGDRAWIAATPVVVDGKLVIAWQDATGSARHAHHVAVLDAATGAIDPAFPALALAATVRGVTFDDATQFSRSTLLATHGKVYVSYGNIADIQPWHGWIFELDLAAWRAGGTAITGVMLTTPEPSCPIEGQSGSLSMICGGGIWSPSGPAVIDTADGYELWVPTGNGQLDLARDDFANTVMRVPPGLAFAPHCTACPTFDPIAPDPACVASCSDLFVPRLRPGDPALAPPMGLCDGKSFFECYGRLDLDLGADSPVLVEAQGKRLAVLPAKDGAVYLFDAAHFGTMYDRLNLRPFCGTNGGTCTANWAGTMVTRPAIAQVDGEPLVIVPTFYFDLTNPAGVVALAIGPGPTLVERWSAPARTDPEAVARFREHTGRAAIVDVGGAPYVAIADPGPEHAASGILYAIDARDGTIVARGALDGPGEKYILPAVVGDRISITSCDSVNDGPTHLETWTLQ